MSAVISQFTMKDNLTGASVSYYAGIQAKNGVFPNRFAVMEKRLAQVFAELNGEFNDNFCFAKICNGPNGAIFDPANTTVECDGVVAQYKPNTIVYFDFANQKFVFEDIGTTKMVDWTSRFRRKVIIGVRSDKRADAQILSPVESPFYVPFAMDGALIPNTYYFGTWGKSYLSVYKKYYVFDMSDNSFTVHMKTFIGNDVCKTLDTRHRNVIIQVKNGAGKVIFQRFYNTNSEFSVSIPDIISNRVVFSDRTIANGFFQQDEDFMNECKANGITYLKDD